MPTRVLLADDHAMLREGLRALLKSRPEFQVVGEAANGREAVREALRIMPDVVVMDIAMPELNGIEATQQLRTECPDIQVVIISAHVTSEHIFRALRAGALGYVLKESAGQEVMDAILSVRAGRRYLSPRINDLVTSAFVRFHLDPPGRSPLEKLSSRERSVLQLVAEGRSSKEIAALLQLAPSTVDTYRSRIMEKLGVQNLAALLRFAVEHNLTTPGGTRS